MVKFCSRVRVAQLLCGFAKYDVQLAAVLDRHSGYNAFAAWRQGPLRTVTTVAAFNCGPSSFKYDSVTVCFLFITGMW